MAVLTSNAWCHLPRLLQKRLINDLGCIGGKGFPLPSPLRSSSFPYYRLCRFSANSPAVLAQALDSPWLGGEVGSSSPAVGVGRDGAQTWVSPKSGMNRTCRVLFRGDSGQGQSSQEIHIDEKTVSPNLSLSEDRKTLTFSPKKAKVDLDCLERFDHWPNALATAAFHSGVCAWKISVEKSCAYKLGVCYSSLPRKGSGNEARLGFNTASWVFSRYDKEFRFLHAGHPQAVELIKSPAEIGVLVDFAGGEVLFYDPDSCTILFSHRETFAEPLYPVFAVAHQSISLVQ